MSNRIALIGFGEAGETFATAARWGSRAVAYDTAPSRQAAMAEAGILVADDAQRAIADAPLILSLVTADQALGAAEQYASFLQSDAIWCDMNSVAPETKRAAARAVETAGARYVDVAILAPVNPARLAVPLLVSGEAASEAARHMGEAGFTDIRVAGPEIGKASAIKMIRSVMVKGIEALTDEMMAAAQAAGVVDEVLSSLDRSERGMTWEQRASYNLERMATHGIRRAAEMEESVKTLEALGVEPVMTQGTVRRQRGAAKTDSQERIAAA